MKFSIRTYTYPPYTQVKSCRFVTNNALHVRRSTFRILSRLPDSSTSFLMLCFLSFYKKIPGRCPEIFYDQLFTSRQNTLCGQLIDLYSVQTVQLRENYYTTWKLQCINTNIYTYLHIYMYIYIYIYIQHMLYIQTEHIDLI
jgi:hypothetical protein